MIATSPTVLEAAARLRAKAPVRAHRIGKPDEDLPPTDQENPMPRGVYDRTKAADKPATETKDAPPPKVKKARKARAAAAAKPVARKKAKAATGARFGVFDDGTIELRLATCTGLVGTEDARALVKFLCQIGIEA